MDTSNNKPEFKPTEICRVCLEVDLIFFNVFTEFVSDKTIAALIMECAPVQISPGDGLSNVICDNCFERLQIAFQFRILCIKSDNELRQEKDLSFKEIFLDNSSIDINSRDSHNVSVNQSIKNEFQWDMNDLKKEDYLAIQNRCINTSSYDQADTFSHVNDDSNKKSEYGSDNKNRANKNTEPKTKPEFVCDICQKVFRYLEILEIHKQKHFITSNPGTDRNTESKTSKVQKKMTDVIERELGCSVDKDMPEINLSQRDSNRNKTDRNNKPKKKREYREYICDICGKVFKQLAGFKYHKRRHAEPIAKKKRSGPLACDICGRIQKFRANLLIHMRLAHSDERPFDCKTCNKRFKDKQTLRKHNFTHDSYLPFLCEHCGVGFRFSSNLYKHLYTHLEVRDYLCNVCDKSFKSEAARKIHKKLHANERPYKCNLCNNGFNLRKYLRKHQSVHTKKRPIHKCSICNEEFQSRAKLMMHKKEHLLYL